jgi:hypothetical protein
MKGHDDKLDMRIEKALKRRFHIECVKRDVSMAYMIKDYIKKQLRFWEKQEREKM